MKVIKLAGVSLLVMQLAACSGSGGGAGPVNSTPTPPTSPTPTPAPSPTPTPTPTPTPSGPTSNPSLITLVASEDFANDAATGTVSFPTSGAAPTNTAAQATATVRYDLASRGYTVTVAGRSQSFLPADLDAAQSNATTAVYVKRNGSTTDSLTVTKPGTSGRFTYQYVAGGFWQRSINGTSTISGSFDATAFGVRTPDTAVPRTGRAEYAVDLLGVETTGDNVFGITGQGLTQIDFPSGTVLTSGTSTAAISGSGTFSSQARLSSASNSFTGNFQFNDFGVFIGQIDGKLYGPAAQEIGAAFSARQSDGRVVVGALTGRGGSVTTLNTTVTAPTVNAFFDNDAATLRTLLTGGSGTNATTGTFSDSSASATPLVVNYDATTRAYTLVAADRSASFGGIPGGDTFAGPNRNTFFYDRVLPTTQYVQGRRWYSVRNVAGGSGYVFTDTAFGIRTADAALPRTGMAGYNVAMFGSAADADLPNLTDFGGRGLMTVNLATGAISASGALDYREDYYIAGRAVRTGSGTFSIAATLSSSANVFAGTINLTGFGTYSGALNGRFYGPTGEEVGAAFATSDGTGGYATGVLTGVRDPAIFATVPGLATLTATTRLDGIVYAPQFLAGPNRDTYIVYDPATQTYSYFPSNPTNAAALAYKFGPGQIVAANSNAVSTAYATTGPAGQFNATDTVAATFFNPGAGNTKLALTYTSFADVIVTEARGVSNQSYAVFGIGTPSAQMPRTGSASYDGIVYGRGQSATGNWSLDGTSTLDANFGSGTFTSALSIAARDRTTSLVTTLAPLTFSGSITGTGFADTFNTFTGNFYGQNAAEFGAFFSRNVTDPTLGTLGVTGIAVGKKR